MGTRTVVIGSTVGLHARPAAKFTQAAAAAAVPVRISLGTGEPVDASSMLAVMTLGAGQGAEVTLHADGDGSDAVLDALADLLASDLDAA
ncbi:HPr family phosphocarrier protein [Nocardia puris]|uniref:Phosphocarrier protein HPr n=1 Tax=Nocardia puris TaxID=208602 RepID=A0A366DJP9_9NOCA|nr:HPr family phosphocarrier protein [Nocardia puris]MBF6213055.1 HPr family phosphocarrier protein [Nocardia puris]MBF6368046.1 HPr family phosphocarrier protein [Nocardia puris]MBF6462679.1 HPr family phosphocarrier protein [Nocardia puris]RBO90300.1 phosphocarrier protein [Nocardia puris]